MRNPYPLQWPDGTFRRPAHRREPARFRVTLAEAIQDLLRELDLMHATNVVITSDLPTRSDGLPYSSGRADDPGIAVWAVVDSRERVFTCDRWLTAAANVRAIGKTVEAIRGLGRWGGSDTITRALGGFAALPPGDSEGTWSGKNPDQIIQDIQDLGAPVGWRDVLGLTPAEKTMIRLGKNSDPRARAFVLEIAKANHRKAIKTAHPDVGGSTELAAEINVALQAAEAELGG